ncbi:MAG: hypothetical protein LAT50_08235 [Ectothiorhodospiraceae bacterium]|nr:hypothetical protein [Paracoccaceae bacterium]MCH8504295.1 hypothetical protein [Ectothiorhodospiraceae bacterium]
MIRHYASYLLLAVLALALSACGWHFRGSAPGAASLEGVTVRLDSQVGRGELFREVYAALQAAGADVVESGGGIPSLVLESERRDRRQISGTRDDDVREYELRYFVTWRIRDEAGETVQGPETLEQIREYRRDQQQVLGGEGQEDAIVREFQRDIAFLLTDRAQALLGE